MNVSEILKGLKGKVLDATHFDLLRHAYVLQEENIKQLKTNNEALKESNSLLLERVKKLEGTQKMLEKRFEELQSKDNSPQAHIKLSELALAVLEAYYEADRSEMLKKTLPNTVTYPASKPRLE